MENIPYEIQIKYVSFRFWALLLQRRRAEIWATPMQKTRPNS